MKKFFVVLLLIAVVVGGKRVLSGEIPLLRPAELTMENPYPPSSPLFAQHQRVVDRFNAEPALRQRFAGAGNSKELYGALNVALHRGAQSVSDERILGMVKAMRSVVPRLSQKSCAKLLLKRDDFDLELGADVRSVLETLPPGAHQRFSDYYIDALLADVKNAPRISVDAEALKNAQFELGSKFQADAERIVRVLSAPDSASEDDRCWGANALTTEMANLAEPNAIALARVSWGGKSGG